MKYLKLKFDNARLIKEKSLKNMLGSNRFFYPINKMHVYNSICILLDRTPKPQLRNTDDKYMPLYDDILEVVSNGYIKINLVDDGENITTIKKDWNSNLTQYQQLTWKDCSYVTGTLLPTFIYYVSEILNETEDKISKMAFDDVITKIKMLGINNDKNEIIYHNEKINNLISWCKLNSSTPISNYIENKQESSRPTSFGKRVNRGIVNSNKYSGIIYIPLNDALHDELIEYTKGFSNILDGGLVKIIDYCEIKEDDLIGFTPINDLNPIKKFNELTNGVDWSNTIYKELNQNDLINSINKIIEKANVSIENNQTEYDEMMKKISKVKFTTDKIGDVAYKINYFIEESINKQYK
jgi:hypothetical protein